MNKDEGEFGWGTIRNASQNGGRWVKKIIKEKKGKKGCKGIGRESYEVCFLCKLIYFILLQHS